MALTAGDRLGVYEVVSSLGAGGMGEVYKARDTRLDRVVAIKVVTAALADDPDLRHRFEQEARSIAALNHPHICTIHDVGRHEGVDFLVMEFLEGETLAERLARSAMTLPDALAIAIQVADALDAAHRVGIVHRDLKPGNVMLVRSSQGSSTAKLLDFGLAGQAPPSQAQRLASSQATVALSALATTPPSATVPGGFSGTVPYMAPEQIDAQAVDHRADIFAFGCVLYEMLAGRKAFDGASTMSVIAAVMTTEPLAIEALKSAPAVLEHLLRRCLEKDRDRRWQNMGDVAGELRWIATVPLTAPAASPEPGRFGARHWLIGCAAAIVIGAMSVLALARMGVPIPGIARSPEQPSLQLEVTTPPTDDPSIALSADGRLLAFVANRNRRPMLWVRKLDSVEARPLPGTEGASLPFWSPDGGAIAFFADGKLKRTDLSTGSSLVVADATNGRGGTWSEDGTILFAPSVQSAIMRVPAAGGDATAVTKPVEGTGHRMPQFLPGGTRFIFNVTLGTRETEGIYLGSLDGTPPVRIAEADYAGRFAAPDRLLAIRQGALIALTLDPQTGAVNPEPTTITRGMGAAAAPAFSTSANGVLAYRVGANQQRQLVWVDRKGSVLGTVGEPRTDAVGSPELSPDERAVTVFLQPRGDNEVAVVELGRNLFRMITNGQPADAHPLWDPDGRHVVFTSGRLGPGPRGPVRQQVDASGAPHPLFPNGVPGMALSWTRDRRYVLLRRGGTGGGTDLVAVSADGRDTIPIVQSPSEETEGQFSPDGRWVAFVSNESGRAEVYLQAFPAGTGRTQLSTAGGTQVRWGSDGREVFYIAPDGKLMAVALRVTATSVQPAAPAALFQTYLATGVNVIGNKPQYAVARDGRFLVNAVIESPATPIVVAVNWMRGR